MQQPAEALRTPDSALHKLWNERRAVWFCLCLQDNLLQAEKVINLKYPSTKIEQVAKSLPGGQCLLLCKNGL